MLSGQVCEKNKLLVFLWKNGYNGFSTQFRKCGDEDYSCVYKDMVLYIIWITRNMEL